MSHARRLRERLRDRVPLPLETVERLTRSRLRSLQLLTAKEAQDFVHTEGAVFQEIARIVTLSAKELATIVSTGSGFGIFLLGNVADLVFHAIYLMLDEIITTIADLIMLLIKTLVELLLSLVQSGALSTILTVAMDVITIFLLDITLPLFMLMINSLMCAFHLFNTRAWNEELSCVEEHCSFDGGGPNDWIVFFDAYPIVDFFYQIIRDTFSAGTRLFSGKEFDLPHFLTGNAWTHKHSTAQADAVHALCALCLNCDS